MHDTFVITRHQALVEYLREIGLITTPEMHELWRFDAETRRWSVSEQPPAPAPRRSVCTAAISCCAALDSPAHVSRYGSGREPKRLWELMARLRDLARLEQDWDSYSAKPLDPGAVTRAINRLASVLLDEHTPEAIVVPTRDGGIQFEWHQRGADVEITVPPVGPMAFLLSDPVRGIEEEGEHPDLDRIVATLRSMASADT